MPTGHEFERECPSCNENSVHRKVTACAFILKGGGGYADGCARPSGVSSKATSPPPG
jgi:predicted nucleic acid-binding Zn ribbon protein